MNSKIRFYLKNYIPFIDKIFNSFIKLKYSNMSAKQIFVEYYKHNKWSSNESLSGLGSEIISTEKVRMELPKIIKKFSIKTMLDIPCGDFHWMKETNLMLDKYIGADIVDNLIEHNSKKYSSPIKEFKIIDILEDPLPKVDLVFIRDLFIHFSNTDIIKSIRNIKESGSKYILTTTFNKAKKNVDIKTGGWHKINLQIDPFLFPTPLYIFNEECNEGKKYVDKSMALWLVNEL